MDCWHWSGRKEWPHPHIAVGTHTTSEVTAALWDFKRPAAQARLVSRAHMHMHMHMHLHLHPHLHMHMHMRMHMDMQILMFMFM